MKHLQYFVILVLITTVAVSLGFASTGKTGTASTPKPSGLVQGGQATLQPSGVPLASEEPQLLKNAKGQIINDPEIRQNAFFTKSRSSRARMSSSALGQASRPAPIINSTSMITSRLIGTYHIPGDFPSIASAVSALNIIGVDAPVTFLLDSASYTENSAVTFGYWIGADSFVTTFRPNAGTAVTINFTPSLSEGKGFAFNGSSRVTIDGVNSGGASLTLKYSGGTFPSADPFAATIYLTNGARFITVQNCNIEGQIQTSGGFVDQTDGRSAIFCYNADGEASNGDVTITGNTITNATFDIKVLPQWDGADGTYQGPVTYTYNKVGGAYGQPISHGALIDRCLELNFSHNIIDGVEHAPYYWDFGETEYTGVWTFGDPAFLFDFGQPSGGHFYEIGGSTIISYNEVRNCNVSAGTLGLYYAFLARVATDALGAKIYDNRIGNITNSDAGGTDIGLRSEFGAIHNSFHFTGAQANGQTSYLLRAVSGTFANNALSNERTRPGGASNRVRVYQGTPGGTTDGNGYFSTYGFITTATTLNAYYATGRDNHSQYGPVNFDGSMHISAPSSAGNIGRPSAEFGASYALALASNDIDGDARDTTIAGSRDAGADESAATPGVSTYPEDVFPTDAPSPSSAGIPPGITAPVSARVKNATLAPATPVKVKVTITGAAASYAESTTVSLGPLDFQTLTFPNWTPSAAGVDTITVTTTYAGDAVANNTFKRLQSVLAPESLANVTELDFDSGPQGWTGSGSWQLSGNFSILGGVYGGSGKTWVTDSTGAGYTNATAHTLTSPFYDLDGITGDSLYMSFFVSLKTEPSWDRMWVQYSNNGVAWTNLGLLNDPNGINWYNSTVWANAAGSNAAPDCWDNVTAVGLGIVANSTDVPPGWTSNGACGGADVHTGPDGYIYVQLKIRGSEYPNIIHASIVRFRILAFGDAGSNDEGFAVDNIRLANTAPVLTPAAISGHVYLDADGSGTDNAMAPGAGLLGNGSKTVTEANAVGVPVVLKYFGAPLDTIPTDGSGNYSFIRNLPGNYNVSILTPLGVSEPIAGSYDDSYPGDGAADVLGNIGIYDGAISGKKFEDMNNNGADNGDPGLPGFVIEVRKDSCTGELYWRSAVTDANGAYSIPIGPGTWYVSENQDVNNDGKVNVDDGYRQTFPADNCHVVTISGPSGGGGSHSSGNDFGNFRLNIIVLKLVMDKNGNGVKEGADVDPLPGPYMEVYDFKKNGVLIERDTLGRGAETDKQFNGMDIGTYTLEEAKDIRGNNIGDPNPGFIRTSGTKIMFVNVTTSGAQYEILHMDYQNFGISGVKYNDLNGNGAKDGGEPGIAGTTISLTGTGGGTATTDGSGNYSFTNVGPGSHTLSEVVDPAWLATQPAGGTTTFTQNSGLAKVQNFGNFQKVCVSGTKYLDHNNNGTREADEPGLPGWKINYGANSAITDANGNFSFCDLGPGTDTLSEVAQAGYTSSEPALGYYVVPRVSGSNVAGLNFGNYSDLDSVKYRTWTVAELGGAGELKPNKKPKAGKPILAGPNTANLLVDMLKIKALTLMVGVPGQLNAGGKEKAYLQPKGQGDAYSTFNKKGAVHTGPNRGFDFDVKGKPMLKRFKSMPSTKKNDVLAAELLALRINLLASSALNTNPGLGDLVINRAGSPWNGMTIGEFAADIDTPMTNYEGEVFALYDSASALAAAINGAFSTGSTTDTATDGGWFSAKLKWASTKAVGTVPFLLHGTTKPKPPVPEGQPKALPTVFALGQNYPNPFNPTTSISFDLPEPAVVTLKVYNMLGQEVLTLLNNESFDAGTEEVEFDASGLSSGVYLYRITASTVDDDGNVIANNAFTTVKKMMLVK